MRTARFSLLGANRSIRTMIVGASLLVAAGMLLPLPAGAVFKDDFEMRVFAEAPELYAKDHSLIRHTDGVYHLFYSVGFAGEGWNLPGNEIDLGHATSTDLIHWTTEPRILPIDIPNGWKARNVWAPHVLRADVTVGQTTWPYIMAYTGVDSLRNQQVGLAVSSDLYAWTDISVTDGAFRPSTVWAAWHPDSTWQNCRDPFIFKNGAQFVMLASASTRSGYLGQEAKGAIAMATSTDGLNWTDIGRPLVMNNHSSLMASSHMNRNPVTNLWNLFYARQIEPGGVHRLTSSQIDQGWTITTDTVFDQNAISSEITDLGSSYLYSHAVDFITQANLEARAVIIDDLSWTQNGPLVLPFNRFYLNWTIVEGQLGAMPTYRDRPAGRGGPRSNVDGLFWVNTSENDSGPYGGGCPTCSPDESYTGVLRSKSFTIGGGDMILWVGGPISPTCYVALVDSTTGTPLRTATGSGSEVMTERTWTGLNAYVGVRAYLEIVDRDPAAHISVDDITESAGPIPVEPSAPMPRLAGLQASPNPTLGPAMLRYELPQSADVEIAIYAPDGRLVRRLDRGVQTGGEHALSWDGRTAAGELAPNGVYFLRLSVDGATAGEVTRLAIVR